MKAFESEGREHAWEGIRQVYRGFLPKSVNVTTSEGKEGAQEVGVRDLHEVRQVRLLAF